MFSVNIDKLVSMTEEEEIVYKAITDKIISKGKKFKSIAILNNNIVAFKLAENLRSAGNHVLFIDADFSCSIFLGKYRLGKNLKGICDYMAGDELPGKIVCFTNKEDMNVVFTGDVEKHEIMSFSETAFDSLLELYKADYDYVIVTVNDNIETAQKCDGTILVTESKDYSEKKSKKEVRNLDERGCLNLGVIINNA